MTVTRWLCCSSACRAQSPLCCGMNALQGMSADDLVQLYDQQTQLLDTHCPLVTVCCRNKPAMPWFDADCRSARRHARAAEIRLRRTRSVADKQAWSYKIGTVSASFYLLHGGPCRRSQAAPSEHARICWRHAPLSQWYSCCCHAPPSCQPPDGRQPSQVERREELLWTESRYSAEAQSGLSVQFGA